jgi:hypothetical protein
MLCLFASEIGALLGENAFVSVDEAIQKVVWRHNPKKIDPKVKELEYKVSACLDGDLEVQQCMMLPQADRATQQISTAQVETIHTQRLEVARAQKVQLAESESRARTPDEVTEVNLQKRRLVDDAEVLEHVVKRAKKAINCQVGIKVEANCVVEDRIPNNQKSFSRYVKLLHAVLYGKVDGYKVTEQQVVEIKTRKTRLWRKLWPSEMIQVMAYMYLSGATSVQFIEKCGSASYTDTYDFRPNEWQQHMEALSVVCDTIRSILEWPATKSLPPGQGQGHPVTV